jgi:2-polyprenyl-3-methyl-5-hydroxy-6-metoxy-1,4-benzoquinol methylase
VAHGARWNHNLHYHRVVLAAVPEGARRVLDVGCGEGLLARELRAKARHVVGIDLHEPSIAQARIAAEAGSGIDFVCGDFLTHPFELASFDAVVSIAMLHHVDASAGLARMREIVRPGGTIVVIGVARSAGVIDRVVEGAAVVANWAHRARKGYWEHSAPTVWPPLESYAAMRKLAERELPGVRYRRHLLWRYSLVWTRP